MTVFGMMSSRCCDQKEQNKTTQRNYFFSIIYVLISLFALYLALHDTTHLSNTNAKVWLLILAVMFPELYVIGHGLINSMHEKHFMPDTPSPDSSPAKVTIDLLKKMIEDAKEQVKHLRSAKKAS